MLVLFLWLQIDIKREHGGVYAQFFWCPFNVQKLPQVAKSLFPLKRKKDCSFFDRPAPFNVLYSVYGVVVLQGG